MSITSRSQDYVEIPQIVTHATLGTRAWTNACRKRSLKIGPPAPAPAWPRPESHQRGGKVCSNPSMSMQPSHSTHRKLLDTVSRPLIIPQPQPPVPSPPPPSPTSLPQLSQGMHLIYLFPIQAWPGLHNISIASCADGTVRQPQKGLVSNPCRVLVLWGKIPSGPSPSGCRNGVRPVPSSNWGRA